MDHLPEGIPAARTSIALPGMQTPDPARRGKPMTVPAHLELMKDRWGATSLEPEIGLLGDTLVRRYGEAVVGVLHYGSCLRNSDPYDGLVDLYVIVDTYRAVYGASLRALLSWLLPPDVFYLEVPAARGTVQAKYALLSLPQLKRGTRRWFHPYLWGRFAQRVALVHSRDEAATRALLEAAGQAVLTFIAATLPVLPRRFSAKDLWEQGLGLSYATELRAERSGRQAELFHDDEPYYSNLAAAALTGSPHPVRRVDDGSGPGYVADISGARRLLARAAWSLRRIQGRLLHVLRLLKNVFTFKGGVDYVLWKLERHSGVRVEVPDRVRRHPLIFGWGVVWRLYRRGAFR